MSEFEEVENMLREMNEHPEQIWAVLPDNYNNDDVWTCVELNQLDYGPRYHKASTVIEAVKSAYDSGDWKC